MIPKKLKKSYINIYEAAAVVLLAKPGRTASFKEIGAGIEKKNLLTNRKASISIAKELELKVTVTKSKYRRWFSFQKPDKLTLKDMI